jgi:hypothetical protein
VADIAEFAEFADEAGSSLAAGPLGIRLGVAFDAFKPGTDPSAYDPVPASRYLLDPPELLTVLHGDTDGLHWGYFVDDPGEPEPGVAATYANDAYAIYPAGDTLVEAVRKILEERYRDALDHVESDPAFGDVYAEQLRVLDGLRSLLTKHGTGERRETGLGYLERYPVVRHPDLPTVDGMGVVAPDAGDYWIDDADRFEGGQPPAPLEERRAYCAEGRRALEAGDAGTALKVGRDLWPFADQLDDVCRLLDHAYAALDRPYLRQTLETACAQRRRNRATGVSGRSAS